MDNFRRRTSESGKIKLDPTTGRGMIGDYEVVDLGLSNGLLFATWNIGATNESEYGNYYQWGAGSATYENVDQYHTGGTNSSYTLPSSADTATQVMGEGWRMPTKTEFQELIKNTTYKWVTINGIKGGKFTSKTNPNAYVFFPAAGRYNGKKVDDEDYSGFYWSSTAASGTAYYLDFYSASRNVYDNYRYYGFSVRGVYSPS